MSSSLSALSVCSIQGAKDGKPFGDGHIGPFQSLSFGNPGLAEGLEPSDSQKAVGYPIELLYGAFSQVATDNPVACR